MVRTTDINMAPVGDPYYALVFQGQPSNVDTVMVDGRILVRGGKLTAVDVAKTIQDAADWPAPSTHVPGALKFLRPMTT